MLNTCGKTPCAKQLSLCNYKMCVCSSMLTACVCPVMCDWLTTKILSCLFHLCSLSLRSFSLCFSSSSSDVTLSVWLKEFISGLFTQRGVNLVHLCATKLNTAELEISLWLKVLQNIFLFAYAVLLHVSLIPDGTDSKMYNIWKYVVSHFSGNLKTTIEFWAIFSSVHLWL